MRSLNRRSGEKVDLMRCESVVTEARMSNCNERKGATCLLGPERKQLLRCTAQVGICMDGSWLQCNAHGVLWGCQKVAVVDPKRAQS
jgi:hypothetical protein